MAVFTPVMDDQARRLLAGYDLGDFVRLQPIVAGVENTNYHLFTERGHYILTLFEGRTDLTALPYYFEFMDAVRAGGVTCPIVLSDHTGGQIQTVAGKKAAILSFLPGRGVDAPDITPDLCHQMGALTAQLHQIGAGFAPTRAGTVGLDYWQRITAKCAPHAPEAGEILTDELQGIGRAWPEFQSLPQGAVHADLFPDNVFMDERGNIDGVIDFYFACTDVFIYDLAIVLNAWCFDTAAQFVPARAEALLAGYQSHRILNEDEKRWFTMACRAGCVRFIVSRLNDKVYTPAQALVRAKDPAEYVLKLKFHQQNTVSI